MRAGVRNFGSCIGVKRCELKLQVLCLAFVFICSAQQGTMLSRTRSADDVFRRFCKLDSQGGQLTSNGWREIAELFVNPGTPRRARIIVSDGGGPLRSVPEGGKIGVGREWIQYGQIDLPQVRFSAVDGLPPGIKVRDSMYVAKISGADGIGQWRIEGPVPEPVVTVDTAIAYVTGVRMSTKDPITRRNAERTLATLKHFR